MFMRPGFFARIDFFTGIDILLGERSGTSRLQSKWDTRVRPPVAGSNQQ
jgi:hypothetical protein